MIINAVQSKRNISYDSSGIYFEPWQAVVTQENSGLVSPLARDFGAFVPWEVFLSLRKPSMEWC